MDRAPHAAIRLHPHRQTSSTLGITQHTTFPETRRSMPPLPSERSGLTRIATISLLDFATKTSSATGNFTCGKRVSVRTPRCRSTSLVPLQSGITHIGRHIMLHCEREGRKLGYEFYLSLSVSLSEGARGRWMHTEHLEDN